MSGYCIYLVGILIQRSSKKQRVVALSSIESKYRSLSQAATEVTWLRFLFSEFDLKWFSEAVIWCDNIVLLLWQQILYFLVGQSALSLM